MTGLAITCIVFNACAILMLLVFSICLLVALKDEKGKDKKTIEEKNKNENGYARVLREFLETKELRYNGKKVKIVKLFCYLGAFLIEIEDNFGLGFTKQVSLGELTIIDKDN